MPDGWLVRDQRRGIDLSLLQYTLHIISFITPERLVAGKKTVIDHAVRQITISLRTKLPAILQIQEVAQRTPSRIHPLKHDHRSIFLSALLNTEHTSKHR
jgi:hypothetical protein